ncbi:MULTISPECIES: sensor histidine kinase [unclassified Microbacterium]|uniref:sensor histidine kinase n=1 Tax=unclassified Microbacterium TaxID=2609290 RepID=UPI0012F9A62D|nr:sensor histidine kinase [Microbacterium sp. MAH-37]MVQ40573.1 sensor histidine kinase [Microbacterium sp. MAH-37]
MSDTQHVAPFGDGAGWGPPPRIAQRMRLIGPVVLSLLIQVPAALWMTVRAGHHGPPGLLTLHLALAIAGPLALLAARRFPGPTVAVVTAFALTDLLTTPVPGPPYIALAFAVVGAVARGAMVWAAVSIGIGWAAALLIGTLIDRLWFPGAIVAVTIALAACFAIGAMLRTRGARRAAMQAEARRRQQSAEERERVRIARELHDVLGHALSQMNVQASVGLHLFDKDPEQARAALQNVKNTSKLALEEVRGVLGVLRDGEAPLVPQAELAELPRLIAGLTTPGLDVELDDRLGTSAPSRAAQFAAYRIVQEALTNIVRHSGAAHARVVLERHGERLVVTVSDDGRGFGGADPVDAGHGGVLGMRERAGLLGGSIRFEDGTDGGAVVVAELPWGRAS